jgi:FtsH-binding integral membrane protein
MAWIGPNQQVGARVMSSGGVRERSDVDTRTFLQRVYVFMSLGLATTGLVALATASSPAAMGFVFGNRLVFFALMIAELLLVLAFAPVAARVSAATASAMFFGYAALSGVTFSAIFLRYTAGSIGGTFLVTGGMFAALSAYGALTKRDLASLGSFCMMGLIGLVIASVVNIFLGSSMLYWLTTFVGVIVFTGLTAYDTAKLRTLQQAGAGREAVTKAALQGALILYLDFINLFLMMLRILGGGRRRD